MKAKNIIESVYEITVSSKAAHYNLYLDRLNQAAELGNRVKFAMVLFDLCELFDKEIARLNQEIEQLKASKNATSPHRG